MSVRWVGSGSEKLKKCLPPSPAILWSVNGCERKPRFKKKKKATEIENKTTKTSGFVTAPEFNRLTKISFDARMKEAVKLK